jgi:hypothetical protein
MKVYIVTHGQYEEETIVKIFLKEESAMEFYKTMSLESSYYNEPFEFEVEED